MSLKLVKTNTVQLTIRSLIIRLQARLFAFQTLQPLYVQLNSNNMIFIESGSLQPATAVPDVPVRCASCLVSDTMYVF